MRPAPARHRPSTSRGPVHTAAYTAGPHSVCPTARSQHRLVARTQVVGSGDRAQTEIDQGDPAGRGGRGRGRGGERARQGRRGGALAGRSRRVQHRRQATAIAPHQRRHSTGRDDDGPLRPRAAFPATSVSADAPSPSVRSTSRRSSGSARPAATWRGVPPTGIAAPIRRPLPASRRVIVPSPPLATYTNGGAGRSRRRSPPAHSRHQRPTQRQEQGEAGTGAHGPRMRSFGSRGNGKTRTGLAPGLAGPPRRPWSRPPVALEGHCHYHGGLGHTQRHTVRCLRLRGGAGDGPARRVRRRRALSRRARPRATSSPGRCGTRSRICTIFRTSRRRRWHTRCHPTGALRDQTPRVGCGPRVPPARGRRCSGAALGARRAAARGGRSRPGRGPGGRRGTPFELAGRPLHLAARRQDAGVPWPRWAPAGATGC